MKQCKRCKGGGFILEPKKFAMRGEHWTIGEQKKPCPKCYGKGVK